MKVQQDDSNEDGGDIISNVSYLPGHFPALQVMLTDLSPSHSFPPWAASTALVLVRTIEPSPQVLEQLLFCHVPQTQSTLGIRIRVKLI